MNKLSNGKPLAETYFALWCRVKESNLIIIENPRLLAGEAGFSGQRSESTWCGRMKKLKELGFIDSKEGSSGDYHYVLLVSPFLVVKKLNDEGNIQESLYNTLYDRMQKIGANDLD